MSDWNAAGCPVPPPHRAKQLMLRELSTQYGLRTLVETGTYVGEMVQALRHHFDRIYSIELSQEFHRQVVRRFRGVGRIRLIQGDSAQCLGGVLAELDGPALFWLDGHYSQAQTAHNGRETPILEELALILGGPDLGHVLVIDDARDFGVDPGYPTQEQVREFVLSRRPDLEIRVAMDAIQITPKRLEASR